jgi:hypothetical protein
MEAFVEPPGRGGALTDYGAEFTRFLPLRPGTVDGRLGGPPRTPDRGDRTIVE